MSRRVPRWWVTGVVGTTLVVVLTAAVIPGALVDLTVYRAGGAAWLHGVPLYTDEFPSWLPFTYPPVAAVAFSVLAMLPWLAAVAVLTAAGMVALSVATALAVPESAGLAAALAATGAIAIEPVRETLMFGQVNLVLMGLVAADCLLPKTRYPRGLLIGIAAAIKLTPAIFVVFFLARRQLQPVVTAAVTFAGVTGFGMLLAPADSVAYWNTTVFDPNRVGGVAYALNQSLRGALRRLDLAPGLEQACWLLLVAAVLALAWHGARRAHRAGDPVVALLVVAAAGLLTSPVSWSHHWVWIVPAIAVCVVRARAALVVATPFLVGQLFLPHAERRELAWSWWQQVPGNSYLLVALGFLGWSVASGARRSAASPGSRPGVRSGRSQNQPATVAR